MKTLNTPQALSTALVSTEVAKLLHKLQGQIIKEASAPREAAPGEIVLQPAQPYTRHTYSDHYNHRVLVSRSDAGDEIHLQTPHRKNPDHRYISPGIWYGTEQRIDAQGRRWESTLPCQYVQDDFGNLVAVRA